jgi:hypothetical protein
MPELVSQQQIRLRHFVFLFISGYILYYFFQVRLDTIKRTGDWFGSRVGATYFL